MNNGATSAYHIHTEQGSILIDCGSGVMSKLSTVMNLYQLDAVLLSHLHFDHIADVGIIQYGFNRAYGISG